MVWGSRVFAEADAAVGYAYICEELSWSDRCSWRVALRNNPELCAAVVTTNALGGSLAVCELLRAYFEPGQDGSDSNASRREA